MTEGVSIRLFPTFRMERDGVPVTPPLHSSRHIASLLCINPDREWSRSDLASLVWPEATAGTHLNRLRTALVQVRDVFEPYATLSGDKQILHFDRGSVTCDLWEARSLVRRIRAALDEATEESTIRRLITIAEPGLLREVADDWVLAERQIWHEHVVAGHLRLAALAEERKDDTRAVESLEALLTMLPYDERAWTAMIRIHSHSGRHIEVGERFDAARVKLQREMQAKFSPSLLSLAASVRKGGSNPDELTQSEHEMVASTFARMLSDAPASAIAFLGTTAFRMEVFRDPKRACSLLEKALAGDATWSEERLLCATYTVLACGMLHNQARIRELAPQILANDHDHRRRRAVAGILAFAHFQVRDWGSATEFGQLSIDEAILLGDPAGIQLARAQMASLELHQGRFDEALLVYDECLSVLRGIESHHALAGQAEVSLNVAYIYFFKQDYVRAHQWVQKCLQLTQLARHPGPEAHAVPLHGAILVALGEREEGKSLVARGLSNAHRLKDERMLEITLEFAAFALANSGEGAKAIAVLEKATEFRLARLHTHSPAELELVEVIRRKAATSADPEWQLLSSRRDVASAVIAALSDE